MKNIQGIPVKKKFGQHFLRDQSIADHMIEAVSLDSSSSVLEIGCGDGFLTRTILQAPIVRLWVFEIDPDWVNYVKDTIQDDRLMVFQENILDIDFTRLEAHKPWVLLSNLPYQITFPILHLIKKHSDLFAEGVVMMQEEVAQKILKTSGRGYGYPSLFFQYYFDWKLLDKIPPDAFFPPPKVDSRLLYFKPKKFVEPIEQETEFWKFIKACFHYPRRTLKNNLQQSHYDLSSLSPERLVLRAQQLSMEDFLNIWEKIRQSGI
ncbi:MAG: 16S rRNA (adenine(1518)-N(6)/adenine(1519)-N(6))-dimethyltransferase RsmA [Candidatus Babeliales bacterium]